MQICKNNYQIKSKQNASLCIVMFLLGGIVSVASEGADKIHLFFFLCMMVKCSLITLLPGVESCLTKARTRVLFNQVNPAIRKCQRCPKLYIPITLNIVLILWSSPSVNTCFLFQNFPISLSDFYIRFFCH